jgi:hypothetical protein
MERSHLLVHLPVRVYILSQKAINGFKFNLVLHDHNHLHFSLHKTQWQLRFVPLYLKYFAVMVIFNENTSKQVRKHPALCTLWFHWT